ncbi:MAG TPA: TrbI/VirB10 family protein [Sphingomicrobium sp.]|nr:TrbI/VirB10 family protein [Sphingomicrobium sp.]
MNDVPGHESPPTKDDPHKFVLRGRPRPVVRFRRGLIVSLTGGAAATLVALSWIALEPRALRSAPQASSNEESSKPVVPEALAQIPKTYADVPRLGPPLPGDLGRPFLEHERSLGGVALEGAARRQARASDGNAEHEEGRDVEAVAAARVSPVLVQLGGNSTGAHEENAPILQPVSAPLGTETMPPIAAADAGQQQKVAFARSAEEDVNPARLHPPVSPFTLVAGTVISATLVTGLNSDLPGMVIAQVTENVRDSATGTLILVPQGAKLIGRYDSVVAYGQRRALVIWTRILFPDASSIDLDNVPATDSSGYAGLRDGVDSHTWQLLKGIGLSTLLGVGTQLSLGSSESDLVRAIRESAQQSAANSGTQITSRDLSVQPTMTIRPGWPVRAILNKDLVLQPWRG